MAQNDDTQPRSPFKDSPPPQPTLNPQTGIPPVEPDNSPQGPGCFLWGIVSVIIFGLSLSVVGMAGAAGWTSGVRIAETDATATVERRINQQFEQIPTDVAAGNQAILQFRLDYLLGVTPGVMGIAEVQQTATQLAMQMQPTMTATATTTPTATPTTAAPEITEEAPPPTDASADDANNSGFDLEALLLEAQGQLDIGEYEEAIDTLDAIMGINPDYRPEVVRDLMSRALRNQAALLFQSIDNVAEAIILTNRAEEFGPVGDLDYERYIGGLYLDAQRTVALGNYLSAIRNLNEIYQLQATYKGVDIGQEIFNQYVAYGDALVAGGQHCQAVGQFTTALNFINSNTVIGKRDAAQNTCQQGITLTGTPGATGDTPPGEQPVAPVGQPGGG